MTVQSSSRKLVVAGLFGFALLWIVLMGLLTWVFGGRASAGTAPVDDGSIKTQITTLDRGKDFEIALSMKITDKADKIVEGLSDRDIEVYEDGQLVHTGNFNPAGQGAIRLALVVDYSSSMNGRKIIEARRAARALIRMLRDKNDYVGLYFFNDQLFDKHQAERLPVAPLSLIKREDAWDALMFTGTSNGSPMLGTMKQGLASLQNVPGRRVMIVLTDGMDTGEPAEIAAAKQAVLTASHDARVPLYMVNLSSEHSDEQMMRELAERTNGQYIGVPDPQKLKEIFENIGKSLQSEYTLTYYSPNPVEDGLKRKVTVNTRAGLVGNQTSSEYNVPGVISTGAANRRTGGGGFMESIGSIGLVFAVLLSVLGIGFLVPFVLGARSVADEEPASTGRSLTPELPVVRPGKSSHPGVVKKPSSQQGVVVSPAKKPASQQGVSRRPGSDPRF